MKSGSVNIDMLDEFVYLAETLSFKRTADHFYLSKSVVSRHMSALEEQLGVRLFERDNRGARLTDAGRAFYPQAKRILNDWAMALDAVCDA